MCAEIFGHHSRFSSKSGQVGQEFEMSGLEDTLRTVLSRRESSGRLRRLTTSSPDKVDFSSNDYLSVSSNREIQRDVLSRLELRAARAEDGEPAGGILGSRGSRLLDGNSSFAESLERKIATFHASPDALLFNSAYDANVGLLSCVPQPGDLILYDEDIHASIHDGMRLSRASKTLPFSHESVIMDSNDAQSARTAVADIDNLLQQITSGERGRDIKGGSKNVFICVEGVYSMDGSVLDLKKVVEAVKKYLPSRNGYIIVDEAHSTGVLGDQGRGLVCEYGLESQVFARVLGFGKAMGCSGGTYNAQMARSKLQSSFPNNCKVFDTWSLIRWNVSVDKSQNLGAVLCSSVTRSYLINYARTLIYTTAPPFSSLVALESVFDYLASGRAEPSHQNLRFLVLHTHQLLSGICSRLAPPARVLRVRKNISRSPIIPVFTSQPRSLASFCQQRGFMVRPIVAPTVQAGSERVRICIHANNSVDHIEGLCRAIEQWTREHIGGKRGQGSAQEIHQAKL